MTDGNAPVRILADGELDDALARVLFAQGLAELTHLPDGIPPCRPSTVTIPPAGCTVPHDHGPFDSVVHVVRGTGRVCWGPRLGHAAAVGPGASVLVRGSVIHQDINDSATEDLVLVIYGDPGAGVVPAWVRAHQLLA